MTLVAAIAVLAAIGFAVCWLKSESDHAQTQLDLRDAKEENRDMRRSLKALREDKRDLEDAVARRGSADLAAAILANQGHNSGVYPDGTTDDGWAGFGGIDTPPSPVLRLVPTDNDTAELFGLPIPPAA